MLDGVYTILYTLYSDDVQARGAEDAKSQLFSESFFGVQWNLNLRNILGMAKKFLKSRCFLFQTPQNP